MSDRWLTAYWKKLESEGALVTPQLKDMMRVFYAKTAEIVRAEALKEVDELGLIVSHQRITAYLADGKQAYCPPSCQRCKFEALKQGRLPE